MTTDISVIRKSLENCIEIIPPCDIQKGSIIKYITLKLNNECFYTGGTYKSMAHNKIILENSGKVWSVPMHKYNKDGTIKYKSRFFILQEETDITCTKEKKHLETIITSQQDVIKKMTSQLKELEEHKKTIQETITKYEQLLQNHVYTIKKKDLEIQSLHEKLLKYEDVIKKLQYYYKSHPLTKSTS